MKLLSKITFWYICIIVVIMSATMYTARNTIASHIRDNEVARLTIQNDSIGTLLQAGTTSINTAGTPLVISKMNGSLPPEKKEVQESTHYNSQLSRNEHRLIVNSYYQVGADVYKNFCERRMDI